MSENGVLRVPVPCPRCPARREATVTLWTRSWESPFGRRRSIWAEEPLSCTRGCVLSSPEVQRLLLAVWPRHDRGDRAAEKETPLKGAIDGDH